MIHSQSAFSAQIASLAGVAEAMALIRMFAFMLVASSLAFLQRGPTGSRFVQGPPPKFAQGPPKFAQVFPGVEFGQKGPSGRPGRNGDHLALND